MGSATEEYWKVVAERDALQIELDDAREQLILAKLSLSVSAAPDMSESRPADWTLNTH